MRDQARHLVMRHLANLESVCTYEGTHDLHMLGVGETVTWISGG